MTGIPLLLLFLCTVAMMILVIARYRVHPFIAIMLSSLLFGLLAGIPIVDKTIDGTLIPGITSVIGSGFAATFSTIGIVIILGSQIGCVLEETGAAMRFADLVVRSIGRKHPVLAVELMGWVVSIAVFCDSGFVMLNPIRKAIVSRTHTSSVAMTVGLMTGLYLSHVFIPPTPGPIAAANTLGIADSLLLVMGFGALCCIFPLIAGVLFAQWIGRRVQADDEASTDVTTTYEQLIASYGQLPSTTLSLAPIAVPLLLMAAASAITMMHIEGTWADIVRFVGTPIISLIIGCILSVILMVRTGRADRLYQMVETNLRTVGPILFITAAGGVLGRVIAATDMVPFITAHADMLRSIGIFFPFLLAAILKTAQGSSTVALTTTAGIVAPLLPALGFCTPVRATLVCMAIGAGAMTVSHANDSFFWVVTNFGSLSAERGYRVQTAATLVLGLSSILEIFLLTLIF